jgi:hypothetical protein
MSRGCLVMPAGGLQDHVRKLIEEAGVAAKRRE